MSGSVTDNTSTYTSYAYIQPSAVELVLPAATEKCIIYIAAEVALLSNHAGSTS